MSGVGPVFLPPVEFVKSPEALRHTYSFSEAFDIAKTAIAERERKESLLSSDPQMFAGEGIGRALQRFATSRHSAAVTASGR